MKLSICSLCHIKCHTGKICNDPKFSMYKYANFFVVCVFIFSIVPISLTSFLNEFVSLIFFLSIFLSGKFKSEKEDCFRNLSSIL